MFGDVPASFHSAGLAVKQQVTARSLSQQWDAAGEENTASRFLVLVNPEAGDRVAVKILQETVAPLFRAAGVPFRSPLFLKSALWPSLRHR